MSKDFDLVAFRDFCAGKGDEAYSYADPLCCACAQFLREGLGITRAAAFPGWWRDNERRSHLMPDGVDDAAAFVDETLPNEGRTFSALASRLSNLIGEGGNG